MHDQDVRRAVDRPGGLDTAPAQHVADHLLEGLGMVFAKRASAPPGSSLVVEVDASDPIAFGVFDTGRGSGVGELPADPTVRLTMERETFALLAGGRRTPAAGAVDVAGDADLAGRVLSGMALTA